MSDVAAKKAEVITLHQGGRLEDALQILRELTAANMAGAEDYSNQGALLRALGQIQAAELSYKKALALDDSLPDTHYNLANLLVATRRDKEAELTLERAVERQDSFAAAWNNLGLLRQRRGAFLQAIAAFKKALVHAPSWREARTSLGVTLLGLECYEEARVELEAVVLADPEHAAAHGNLSAMWLRNGQALRAETASRAAIRLSPVEHRWWTNLAVALQTQGRHAETEACLRQALRLKPDYAAGHGNLLFALNYRPDLSDAAIFSEYIAWDAAHAVPLAPADPQFTPDRQPGRRLRVGYVSPDFRTHAVALFSEPLLMAHDPAEVELFLYAEVAVPDTTSQRFQALGHWRSTIGCTDAEVAEMVRSDRIDVLVDLAGHTAGNRLLAFARRPAPVQVATQLGHGGSSGLSAMSAFITDADVAPVGSEMLFSERVFRINRVPIVYSPPAGMPAVARLPAILRGNVTFGHFGRPERLNDETVAAWAAILLGVPGARLMLNSRAFLDDDFTRMYRARFAKRGIEAHRLDLVFTFPQSATWFAYGEIDIALDPFPHNAGTTTVEALWQGVPVVSLASRPGVGRLGASILRAVGLEDWIVTSDTAYVARAIAAATDLPALSRLRGNLRSQVALSPLCDAGDLARVTEAVYRTLWDGWRDRETAELRRLYSQGNQMATRHLAQQLVAVDKGHSPALHTLALLAHADGDFAAAEGLIGQALESRPTDSEMLANRAAILRALGRLDEAEAAARQAIASDPMSAAACNNLGNILRDAGRAGESIAAFQQAVHLAPGFADAWSNMAWVLSLNGQAAAAEVAASKALASDPRHANAHNNLGLALMRQNRLEEAETSLRTALALKPDFALPHSNILFCLNYRSDLSAEAIFAEYKEWDARHARRLLPKMPPRPASDRKERRLRVGYVSPDFRAHAAALFAEPLLKAHDRAAVELFLYAEVAVPDETTVRLKRLADHWRCTVGLTDTAMADLIRADQIDVLIDLAGHTAGNRLLVFARRPALVQVATQLGHGTTSGLSAIDAFLADAQMAPPGSDHLFSERTVLRLPRIPIAYAPPVGMPPVADLPARARGYVTFGYFGRTIRLNDDVVACWAAILHACPRARLVLNSAPFLEVSTRDKFAARFVAQGIEASRLDLTFTSPQSVTWSAYAGIDIALDPFPHNAGTTTIEALWQGVPVVSLAERPGVGRLGASILSAAGLQDWVCYSQTAYVERATAAACDIAGLAHLRARMRDALATSPLLDAPGLAREVEKALHSLWDQQVKVSTLHDHVLRHGVACSEKLAAEIISVDPNQPAALHTLGIAALARGNTLEAVRLIACAARPADNANILADLGVVLRRTGRLSDSEAATRSALNLEPDRADILANLGNLLLEQHRLAEALTSLTEALHLAPNCPRILRSLALCQISNGAGAAAELSLRQALHAAPSDADAHETLAALLGQSGRPVEAEAHYRAALPHHGARHRVLSNLAISLQAQGRHIETEACLREAVALRPDYAPGHSNLLYALNYRHDISDGEILAEYKVWDAVHARPRVKHELAPDPLPGRRLRIGYVSPDFRSHAAALFSEPLLAAHDVERVELFLYAEVQLPDVTSSRFQALGQWRSTVGLPDANVAEMVSSDRIDVLVDLAGHTAGNRLLAFAHRPAPVQVATQLGHGTTSGLSDIDAFIADADTAPPGSESLFSESVVRLTRIPIAYAPPEGMPAVSNLPALLRRHVTYGHFGRPERLNDATLDAWAAILRGVSGSRLVLNSLAFQEPALAGLYRARLIARGVQAGQVDFLFTSPQPNTWAAYSGVDIALDPFPHNAGTTTIEALWQGVPVVSLASRPGVGRLGASILKAAGLCDWVVADVGAYVVRAVSAAADLPTLALLRHRLREQVRLSPLCDSIGLARELEAVYRSLLDNWQDSKSHTVVAE